VAAFPARERDRRRHVEAVGQVAPVAAGAKEFDGPRVRCACIVVATHLQGAERELFERVAQAANVVAALVERHASRAASHFACETVSHARARHKRAAVAGASSSER
jgi:hypothetical protein